MEELLLQLIAYAADDYTENQESYLKMLLDDALDEILEIMYPYGFLNDREEQKIKEKAIKKYKRKIRKIAEFHYDKTGREGVTGFSENGLSVSYETAGTPPSYFRGIVPIARIIRGR